MTTSNGTDWTKVSPAQLTLWYHKLGYHRFDDDLTQDELKARETYKIVTAILDLADPPSGAGYYAKRISEYHATWIARLPLFERIGHVEVTTNFVTNEIFYRLWLLADWNSTEAQLIRKREIHKQHSLEWMDIRVRYWRVYKSLRKISISAERVQEILNSTAQGFAMKLGESENFLRIMGFYNQDGTDTVDPREHDEFLREFVFKPGHVYLNAWDFTQPS